MTFEHESPRLNAGNALPKKVLVSVTALLLVGGIVYGAVRLFSNTEELRGCTLEAKLCPDGSAVGRTGPNCEFPVCPEVPPIESTWNVATDTAAGLTFRYPEGLSTTYIHVVDWPPQVRVVAEPFSCAPGGSEVVRAGITEERLVGTRAYCVTKESEGAAGSTYTNYAYAFRRGSTTVILTFSTRSVQCGNYDDPERTACENERASFDLDGVVDRMAQSIRSL